MEDHINEIIALFEVDPKPVVSLSWLVKVSEVLHQRNKHSISKEVHIKLAALIVRCFIQMKKDHNDKYLSEYDAA